MERKKEKKKKKKKKNYKKEIKVCVLGGGDVAGDFKTNKNNNNKNKQTTKPAVTGPSVAQVTQDLVYSG